MPEATAGKFLVGGPTSRAAAEDLSRIIARSPDPTAAKAAATDYVLADAVRSGVIQDGRISETRLAAFIANREGMFGQVPEIKGRFDDLLKRVRSGTASANRLAADLAAAKDRLKITERDIDNGVLRTIVGSEPRKAVAAVFASRDSVAAMREAVRAFRGDPRAREGWKAAVAEWLQESVASASKAGVSGDEIAADLAAMRRAFDQNERALAEVFTSDEMSALRQAQKRLEILSRRGTQGVVGAPASDDLSGIRGVLTAFAKPAGTALTFAKNAITAGMVERRIRLIAEQFPDGNAAAKAIIDRAWTDPQLAQHLLNFPTSDAQVYDWSKKLNRLLVLSNAGEDR